MIDSCVILAGGLGTRLQPRTETVPKTLVEIAGRPFAHWQLSWLAGQGVTKVTYCIGHLGDQVRDYVGTGEAWGLEVQYVQDPVPLRGTAGALRLALEAGLLEDAFFVLYGDSYLDIELEDVASMFVASGLPALLTVYRNEGQWDRSNVVFEDGCVRLYRKHHPEPPVEMRYIDYGVSVLSRAVVVDMVPAGKAADLAPVLTELSVTGRLAGYEAQRRFFEIGTPSGIEQLEGRLTARP